MLSPLPNLGAAITWMARCACYGQDRRNEAQRPAAEESRSGLAAPCSRWLWLCPCISYASATVRIYIRGAGLGHTGLGLVRVRIHTVHSPGRGLTKGLLEHAQAWR